MLIDSSQDQSLVDLLTRLAGESVDHVISTLEDNDSVLSQVPPCSREVYAEIEHETNEMSQRIWTTPSEQHLGDTNHTANNNNINQYDSDDDIEYVIFYFLR